MRNLILLKSECNVPILLLDDIFDKLDQQRVAQIIKLVHDDSFGQIFISDTHAQRRTLKALESVDSNFEIFQIN